MKRWQLQEAKARLSELVKAAGAGEPQEITVHGKPAAIVLSPAQFETMKKEKKKPSFVEFMLNSPLRGSGIRITRDKSTPRKLDL